MPDWEAILAHHGPAAWRTAYRLVGNRADADECFQDACLAAVEVARREPVRAWGPLLQRLAASRAIDRVRLRQRRGTTRSLAADPQDVCDPAASPAESAEENELVERLRVALGRIPPEQAEVFSLHALEGWSYEEIATHFHLSIDAVGVRIHRARQRLKVLLEEGFAPSANCRSRKEAP